MCKKNLLPVRSFLIGMAALLALFAGVNPVMALDGSLFHELAEPPRKVELISSTQKGKKISLTIINVYTRPIITGFDGDDPILDRGGVFDPFKEGNEIFQRVVLEKLFPVDVDCPDPNDVCSLYEIFFELVQGDGMDKLFSSIDSQRTIWEICPNCVIEDPPGSGSLSTIANQEVSRRMIEYKVNGFTGFTYNDPTNGNPMVRGFITTDQSLSGPVTVHAIPTNTPKSRKLVQGPGPDFKPHKGSFPVEVCTLIPLPKDENEGQNSKNVLLPKKYINVVTKGDGCTLNLAVAGANFNITPRGSSMHLVDTDYVPPLDELGNPLFCTQASFNSWIGGNEEDVGNFSLTSSQEGCFAVLTVSNSPVQDYIPTALGFLIPICQDVENPPFFLCNNGPPGNCPVNNGAVNTPGLYCDSTGLIAALQ